MSALSHMLRYIHARLQEELADEVKNREAATARLELMSQAIPNLHKDLKRVQDQLVQSRMEVRSTETLYTLRNPSDLAPPPRHLC